MKIHLIMSAETVGLGTMIDEYVMVSSGKSVAEVIEERLAAYGYTTIHDGSPSGSDYWLRHIQKQGILEGWSISEEERSLLEEEGFWLDENPASLDSLGEPGPSGTAMRFICCIPWMWATTWAWRSIREFTDNEEETDR